ncbi:MAG: hypothetical protein L6V88_09385 [Anaerotruncus sp.]|nr:MAG: hypothetical protein L6V88_09385 [Anaerotruncus sp.]
MAQIALRVQMLCGVNRLKNKNIKVQKGCNWFSITGAFAAYIAQESKPLEENLSFFSYCGDEVFVQTALLNSPFAADAYMKKTAAIIILPALALSIGSAAIPMFF